MPLRDYFNSPASDIRHRGSHAENTLVEGSLVGMVGTAPNDSLEVLDGNPVWVGHAAQIGSPETDTIQGGDFEVVGIAEEHSLHEVGHDARVDSLEAVGTVTPGDLGTRVQAPLGIYHGSGTVGGCCILAARVPVHCNCQTGGLDHGHCVAVATEVDTLPPCLCSQSEIRRLRSRFRCRLGR